jgi:hypothetical protein
MKTILPDWITRRQRAEEVENFLDKAAKQVLEERIHAEREAKRGNKVTNDLRHISKMKAKRRARNKQARISRRRNRA